MTTPPCVRSNFLKLPSKNVSLVALLPLVGVYIATQSCLIIVGFAMAGVLKIGTLSKKHKSDTEADIRL
jgi:hypothetical protein